MRGDAHQGPGGPCRGRRAGDGEFKRLNRSPPRLFHGVEILEAILAPRPPPRQTPPACQAHVTEALGLIWRAERFELRGLCDIGSAMLIGPVFAQQILPR